MIHTKSGIVNNVVTSKYGHTRRKILFVNIPADGHFIPFSEVMPFAHVFISNGGYGGVMQSIVNKLPMVVAGIHDSKQ